MAVPLITSFEQKSRTVRAQVTGELSIERTFYLTPFAAYPRVLDGFLGGVRLVGGRLIRVAPLRDPYHPFAVCMDVAVDMVHGEAVATGGPFASAALAAASVEAPTGGAMVRTSWRIPRPGEIGAGVDEGTGDAAFGNNATPQQERNFAEESFTFSAKNITLPNDRLKWDGSNEALSNTNVQAVKTIPHIDYTLTRHFLLKLPHLALTKLMGRINENTFRVADVVWPAECVRLDGGSAQRKITLGGLPFYDLTLRWAIQPTWDNVEDGASNDPAFVGWNRFFRPDTALWEYAVHVADTSKNVYELDTGISQTGLGKTITGFDLLFWSLAN